MRLVYFGLGAFSTLISIFFVIAVQDAKEHGDIIKEWRGIDF